MTEFVHCPKHMPKSRKFLFPVMVAAAVVNSATMGYDSMMMSSLIAIPQFTEYFNLNAVMIGLINASIWIGAIISCLFMQQLSDNLGRKKTIIIASGLSFVGVILQTACTRNIGMFIFARIVLGFCTQLTGVASPLIIAEVSPKEKRGLMVGLYFSFFNAGSILATAITFGSYYISGTWSWRLPALLQGVPSAISLALIYFIPESPRWLLANGKHEYASEVLQVIMDASPEEAEEEAEVLRTQLTTEIEASKGAWKDLMKLSKPNIRRVVIVLSLALLAELAGSSVGSYYFTVVLQQAGVTQTAKLLLVNLISSVYMFACSIAGSYSFDFWGRKAQAFWSVLGMIISFFLLGGFVKMFGDSDNTSGQYATIFFMFVFNGFFCFSIVPLECLYPAEIFPMKTRAAGSTLFCFWNNALGLVATFILPIAMENIGWKFYMVNGGYDIIFLIIIYFVWVETKGISLEEVSLALGEKICVVEGVLEVVDLTSLENLSLKDVKSPVKVVEA